MNIFLNYKNALPDKFVILTLKLLCGYSETGLTRLRETTMHIAGP